MGAALNSFLQSEINNIAGSALKSVDITLGMEQYDQNGTGSGGERTDFSFRFAKRFYNDRISIILGGRVSTGQDVGIVLRKKMLHLRELFIFKKNKPKPVTDDKQTEEKK